MKMATARHLTEQEQFLLDVIADREYQKLYGGDLIVVNEMMLAFDRMILVLSFGTKRTERLIADKIERLKNRTAEEYDDRVEEVPSLARAPFGLDWEDVPMDDVTRQYLKDTGQTSNAEPVDRLGAGSADLADRERKMRLRQAVDPGELRRAKAQDERNRELHQLMAKVDPVSTRTKSIPEWLRDDLTARDRNTGGADA